MGPWQWDEGGTWDEESCLDLLGGALKATIQETQQVSENKGQSGPNAQPSSGPGLLCHSGVITVPPLVQITETDTWWMLKQNDRWMDGWTDGGMDRWMDGQTCSQATSLGHLKLSQAALCYIFRHACCHGTQTLKEGLGGLINKTEAINLGSY